MDREIKFRALTNGQWVYFSLSKVGDMGIPLVKIDEYHWRHTVTGQVYEHLTEYTGHKDKDGVEIFEGDVLLIDGTITGAEGFGAGFVFDGLKIPVVWDAEIAAWTFDTEDDSRSSDYYDTDDPYSQRNFRNHVRAQMFDGKTPEVIGNIYQNSYLLNTQKAAV